MDVIILSELKDGEMSGYDAISYIHKRFGVLMSSGTVYSVLYSMERDGLIKSIQKSRKKAYVLAEKGKQRLEDIKRSNGETYLTIKNALSVP
jgi:DNA-binding PadR family transcriptional regulator